MQRVSSSTVTPPSAPVQPPVRNLSADVARRIALAAQGFADPRPSGPPGRRQLSRVLSHTQLLQLDSVNVAVRAHYMPLFSRLGPYSPTLLEEAAWSPSARRPRLLVEYWAHVASLIPVADWPLFRERMRRYAEGSQRYYESVRGNNALIEDVLAVVKQLGPISAGPIEDQLGVGGDKAAHAKGGWWNRSEVKRTCEYLFAIGELTTGTRRGFERLYDLTERVLPPEVHAARYDVAHAHRELTERAARALGVATEPDLRDYYRLAPKDSQQAVAELVEAGVLEPVTVTGWRSPAYRHVEAKAPRRITARALLCPFDPVVWRRERTERLFDFHYRIEIYVPEPERVYGYYVYPFLLDEELVARVDLKADRAAGLLRVPGAFAEAGAGVGTARVVAELAEELRSMAGWLGLDGVVVGTKGDLAAPLRRALR
ncbi:MAG TPA: crosslink repair DNA glycosylase YcaQ family protein [Pseudonocardiaceae bacterium]|nr:crosslink repair DNA glycosylase YcaQ family protein [Pseudonocardiaceae bacterium]